MVRDSCGVAFFGFLAFERFSGTLRSRCCCFCNIFFWKWHLGVRSNVVSSLVWFQNLCFINFLGRESRYQAIDRVRYRSHRWYWQHVQITLFHQCIDTVYTYYIYIYMFAWHSLREQHELLCKKKRIFGWNNQPSAPWKLLSPKDQWADWKVGSDGLSPFPKLQSSPPGCIMYMFRLGDAELNLHLNGNNFICH